MIGRATQINLWRWVRRTWRGTLAVTLLLLVSAIAFRWYHGIGSLEDLRSRIILTLLGVVVTTWLGVILVAGVRRWSTVGIVGLVTLVGAQVFFLVLVWTPLKPHMWIWRAWWIAMIASITLAHLMWVRFQQAGRSNWIGLTTRFGVGGTGLMIGSLALRRNVLDETSDHFLIVLCGMIFLTVIGSTTLWIAHRRRTPPGAASRWRKLVWVVTAQAAVFFFGFYSGRITAHAPAAFDSTVSPLAHFSRPELEAQLDLDLTRLKAIATGIDELAMRAGKLSRNIREAKEAEKRAYYLPSEEDALKSEFMTYLAYRAALLRIVAAYAGFESVPDPTLRARCFLVGYGAGATVMRASTLLVTTYGTDEVVRRKLNESDDTCGIRPGEFNRIYDALLDDRNATTFERMAKHFESNHAVWSSNEVLPKADMAWVEGQIERCIAAVHARPLDRSHGRLARILQRVEQDVNRPLYDAQSMLSTLIGDTRMVKRDPFITHEQVLAMQVQLRPGDILLERRNWFMSNAFLPGFWPHAALYVGTIEDLDKLGLVLRYPEGGYTSDDPHIRDRLAQFTRPGSDHQQNTVIESVSEGVIFNTLTHSMHADYVAVLRPKHLTDEQRAKAIARAFSHVGKPYDFEFDFFSADKLVCTELVYRSYQGMLHFNLVHIMGRDTLPALEICKKFATERERPGRDQELDFVMFLDAVPGASRAKLANADDFCASARRPRGFNE